MKSPFFYVGVETVRTLREGRGPSGELVGEASQLLS